MNADTHDRSVVVWSVPTAIQRGETFSIKVGLKCSAACQPDAWTIEVRDHRGNAVASARLGSEPWSGTEALYYAKVRLTAPAAEGLYAWEAFAPAVASEADRDGHCEARGAFSVRAVPAPECRLTVVAVDKESRSPVKGARIVVHPYRALTDEHGVAQLRVPKGLYRLFVSGRDYYPFRGDGEVAADATVRAELEPDPGPSDAELWS